jgi:hypothetical protein
MQFHFIGMLKEMQGDVGVRLGARSRQIRLHDYFMKKAKYRYKHDNTLSMACLYETKEPQKTYYSS